MDVYLSIKINKQYWIKPAKLAVVRSRPYFPKSVCLGVNAMLCTIETR
jgi:hypothetical protein